MGVIEKRLGVAEMLGAGLEPARPKGQGILSLLSNKNLQIINRNRQLRSGE
jgi:hypothetical protein